MVIKVVKGLVSACEGYMCGAIASGDIDVLIVYDDSESVFDLLKLVQELKNFVII